MTSGCCWCQVVQRSEVRPRSSQQIFMSPCTPAACWVGPGRARWRLPPRRCQRRWSSWCRPGCTDCRCSKEDFDCGKEERRELDQDWDHSHLRGQVILLPVCQVCFLWWLTLSKCRPHWTGRPRSAQLTLRWRRFPASPETERVNMRLGDPVEATGSVGGDRAITEYHSSLSLLTGWIRTASF